MTDDDLSTPSLNGALERLKGGVKRVAGAALGDEQLRHEGELHDEKADAMAEARQADADAERRQREADADRRAAELTAEQRELLAEEVEDQHLERIEHV